jgi:predicted GNAT family acetyltransferase
MLNYWMLLPYLIYVDAQIGVGERLGDHCLMIATQSSARLINRVCHTPGLQEADIQRVKQFFGEKKFSWYVESRDVESRLILEKHGLEKQTMHPAMSCDLSTFEARISDTDMRIDKIALDGAQLETWISVAAHAFSFDRDDFGQAIRFLIDNIHLGYVDLYLGYCDGEPMATGMLIKHKDEVATVHWISTSPTFRKRGFGSVISARLLSDAKNANFKIALLIASVLGKPVYESLGFHEYAQYDVYGN